MLRAGDVSVFEAATSGVAGFEAATSGSTAFAGTVSTDLIPGSTLSTAFVEGIDGGGAADWVGMVASMTGVFTDATNVVVDGHR